MYMSTSKDLIKWILNPVKKNVIDIRIEVKPID